MKYVLMFCETEQWDKAWQAMDQAERDAGFAKRSSPATHERAVGAAA